MFILCPAGSYFTKAPYFFPLNFSLLKRVQSIISLHHIGAVQQVEELDPTECFLFPFPSDAAPHHNENAQVWSTCLAEEECLPFSPSLEKGPSEEAYCSLLYHRGSAIGIQALVIVINGRTTRESHWRSDHWSASKAFGLLFHWIGMVEDLYSPYSLYAAVLQAQLCLAAWGVMSRCPDESKAFCGWAHLSSAVSPQLWRLPCLLLFG